VVEMKLEAMLTCLCRFVEVEHCKTSCSLEWFQVGRWRTP